MSQEFPLSHNQNPLLRPSNHPHRAIPFPEIKEEHFLVAFQEAIQLAQKELESLKHNKAPIDFFNTIEAMEMMGEKVDLVSSVFYNLLSTDSTEGMESLAEQIGPLLANYSNDLLLDEEIFARVKKVHADYLKGTRSLNREQQSLLEKVHSDFVRNGALLDSQQKKKLREIDEELSKLGPQFNQNVLKATTAFHLPIENLQDLEGLPESVIERAQQSAQEKKKSGWVITLDAPSYVPFMKHSTRRALRESLWKAYNSRCCGGPYDNSSIIKKIVQLRYERAVLLGYSSHADFVLRRRMAETPDKVKQFLFRLLKFVKPAAEKEIHELSVFAKESGGPQTLMPWDFAFYAEKFRQAKFDFDEEKLRPFFQLEKVVEGVFAHAQKLFSLKFKSNAKIPVYHSQVRVYEVSKENTGEFIGLLYMDFFPRESKKGGAWATNFYEQGAYRDESKGSQVLLRPHVGIVCNFTPATPDKPSLLSLDEVETLFHEFGHALHSLLSRCHYRSLAGTNVYWDFVELPSQIMENWVTEKEALDLFAHHYKTGQVIEGKMAAKIKETSQFLAGYHSLRQLNFAFLDLAWHEVNPTQIEDIASYEIKVTEATNGLPRIPGAFISPSFAHIFSGGYSSGYYSYKWAEVLDADAFELFKEKGLFNQEVGRLFEEHILSRGGSEHPMDLYQKFRGREPDPDALLRRLGLVLNQ